MTEFFNANARKSIIALTPFSTDTCSRIKNRRVGIYISMPDFSQIIVSLHQALRRYLYPDNAAPFELRTTA